MTIAGRLTADQRRFVKFCTVGASGVGVNLGFVWVGLRVFAALPSTLVEPAASALGIVVSIFTNFLINDGWTWSDRQKGRRKRDFLHRAALFYVTSAVAAAVQFGTAVGLNRGMGVDIYLAQLIGIVPGTAINYAVNNVWTFRDRPPPPA